MNGDKSTTSAPKGDNPSPADGGGFVGGGGSGYDGGKGVVDILEVEVVDLKEEEEVE